MVACGGGLLAWGNMTEEKGEGLQASMQITTGMRKKMGQSQAKHLRY